MRDLSWLEIVHVFADLWGVNVSVDWYGDLAGGKVEFYWRDRQSSIDYQSGLGRGYDSIEESAKHLLQNAFRWGAPKNITIPKIEFETAEELELKLIAADMDVKFMLTHRCGG